MLKPEMIYYILVYVLLLVQNHPSAGLNSVMTVPVLRQEIDGLLGQTAGVVLCRLILQDKNEIKGRGWVLPGLKRPHISHSQNQETSLTTHAQKSSWEVKKGGGANPAVSHANYP